MSETPVPPAFLPPPSPALMALGIGAQAWISGMTPDQRTDAAATIRRVIAGHIEDRPKVIALLPLHLRQAIESDLQTACTWWERLLESLDL